jgi:hypothetical protein
VKLTKEQIEYAKRVTVAAVVDRIATERKIAPEDALRDFSRTKTFEALQSDKGRLYLESNEYVLDMLDSEQRGDWENWLKV